MEGYGFDFRLAGKVKLEPLFKPYSKRLNLRP